MTDPVYERARLVLVDALLALRRHSDGVVVVGAQAIYVQTDPTLVATAPFTADADLCLVPAVLAERPGLQDCLREAGFRGGSQPGSWRRTSPVATSDPLSAVDDIVDVMVPSSLVQGGRRSARLGGDHDDHVARRTDGLVACTVDHTRVSLEAAERRVEANVAGPAALLAAKLYKLGERADVAGGPRLKTKDAIDVLRLLRHDELTRRTTPRDVAAVWRQLLQDARCKAEASRALEWLGTLFGRPGAIGTHLAVDGLRAFEQPDLVAATCTLLAAALARRIREEP